MVEGFSSSTMAATRGLDRVGFGKFIACWEFVMNKFGQLSMRRRSMFGSSLEYFPVNFIDYTCRPLMSSSEISKVGWLCVGVPDFLWVMVVDLTVTNY